MICLSAELRLSQAFLLGQSPIASFQQKGEWNEVALFRVKRSSQGVLFSALASKTSANFCKSQILPSCLISETLLTFLPKTISTLSLVILTFNTLTLVCIFLTLSSLCWAIIFFTLADLNIGDDTLRIKEIPVTPMGLWVIDFNRQNVVPLNLYGISKRLICDSLSRTSICVNNYSRSWFLWMWLIWAFQHWLLQLCLLRGPFSPELNWNLVKLLI